MNHEAHVTTGTMTAWRQARYGGPEAVIAERVDVPTPARGEALIRLRATGLNNGDVRVMHGEPLLVRPVFGLRRPRVATRGMDAAGTVVALGADAGGVAVGDEVVGELPAGGGLAEYAVAPVARLVPRPAGVDPVVAAALPVAAGTAWQALDLGGVAAGGLGGVAAGGLGGAAAEEGSGAAAEEGSGAAAAQRVLVIGASGGVGTFVVQLAALRGAEVWALCGARNEELVAELGAVRTFDYRRVDLETSDATDLPTATFDAVIDIAGTAPLRRLKALLRPGGTLVLVSGEGGRVLGPIGRILRASVLSMGGGRRIRPLAAVAKPEVTRQLLALCESGLLAPVIERTWPLASARDALSHVDAGHAVGKVVVVMAER